MQDLGIGRGSIVAVNSFDMLTTMTCLVATSLLGARLITANKLLARDKVIKPTHFLRSEEATGTDKVAFEVMDATWHPSETTRSAIDNFPGCASDQDDWMYLHTSGTTGKPKYIAMSEAIVRDRSAAVVDNFPRRATTMGITFAAHSRPFYARAAASLMQACAIVESTLLEDWLSTGVNVVCASPGQIAFMMKDQTLERKIGRLEVSGAKLSKSMLLDLLRNFRTVVDVYGATETNKSFETIHSLNENGVLVSKGHRRDVEVEILAEDGSTCGTGEMGHVRVRNHYLVDGYLNAPEATEKSFRGGWFYPGDLATWGHNGELVIIGRDDDLINVGGYKMNAGMLDLFFAAVPGISEAIVFRNPKPDAVDLVLVWAVFEDDVAVSDIATAACALAADRLGILIMPTAVRAVGSIPRTADGDPDRKACVAMVRERAGMEELADEPG
mmetsp:Transcript_3359/g.5810  ORF Transcript_3359/g.5810 Transcript_3359/m.5810 type:complete len:443 (+) Transcript_3359:983-2311(+)